MTPAILPCSPSRAATRALPYKALLTGGTEAVGSALYHAMIEVDDSELPPEYRTFLQEWAEALGVSIEILLGRIVVATIEGNLYTEKIPDYYP